ncbi:hypothetical protein P9112_012392 [Eukaryota sp. TZLM1-RC]
MVSPSADPCHFVLRSVKIYYISLAETLLFSKIIQRLVYLESNRQKWRIIKFDNRRQKERRFRESLNKFQRLTGHGHKLYLAVGSANLPSYCRKINRYGSARAFREWLCYQKDVKHLSTRKFNTSKLSSWCMVENIQAGSF